LTGTIRVSAIAVVMTAVVMRRSLFQLIDHFVYVGR
jgi:hypothetical protein